MVLSKLIPVEMSCAEFAHPWTESCFQAFLECYINSLINSFQLYSTVYGLTLLTRGKFPPTKEQLKKLMSNILQTTFYVGSTIATYTLFICFFRKILGHFNFLTISAIPGFLAATPLLYFERPSRINTIALYCSKITTEVIWNMAVDNNLFQPIKYGQVGIFSVSVAIMLFYYKLGVQHNKQKADIAFSILRYVVGPYEEKQFNQVETIKEKVPLRISNHYPIIALILQKYSNAIQKIKPLGKHQCCLHPYSCIFYTLEGATKMFCAGLIARLGLKTIFNIKRIFKSPNSMRGVFLTPTIFSWAIFLGAFSGVFRGTMCILRHLMGKDDPTFGLVAGTLAGLTSFLYPNVSVALYTFWKMLHITCNIGIENGIVPVVPKFAEMFCGVGAAFLVHLTVVAPKSTHPEFWKFMNKVSGGRSTAMNRAPLDVWGMNSAQQVAELLQLRTQKL